MGYSVTVTTKKSWMKSTTGTWQWKIITKSSHHPLPFFERSSSDLQRQATDELEILRNWMLRVGARATTPDAPQKKKRQWFFCWRQPINHEKMMKKWLNPTENLMESKKMSNNSLKFTSNSFVNSLGIDFRPCFNTNHPAEGHKCHQSSPSLRRPSTHLPAWQFHICHPDVWFSQ